MGQARVNREPNIQDIGALTGEVLVFGGPYSNLQATRSLISAAVDHGIRAENCICSGDLVAYCADASGTVRLVRDFGCPVVAGNCEHQLAAGASDCGCGFEAGSTCDLLSAEWYAHASGEMTVEDRQWMGGLPDIIRFTYSGRTCVVLHGGSSDVARFIWPSSDHDVFQDEINIINGLVGKVDVVLAGHSGLAFTRQIGSVTWINAGVIGMPPHDGRPETRYAIFSDDGVRFHTLDYDWATAAARMKAAGLTQGYQASLQSGIWPSEDVLPVELRRG